MRYITPIDIHTTTDSWKKEITISRKVGVDKVTSPVALSNTISGSFESEWRWDNNMFPDSWVMNILGIDDYITKNNKVNILILFHTSHFDQIII